MSDHRRLVSGDDDDNNNNNHVEDDYGEGQDPWAHNGQDEQRATVTVSTSSSTQGSTTTAANPFDDDFGGVGFAASAPASRAGTVGDFGGLGGSAANPYASTESEPLHVSAGISADPFGFQVDTGAATTRTTDMAYKPTVAPLSAHAESHPLDDLFGNLDSSTQAGPLSTHRPSTAKPYNPFFTSENNPFASTFTPVTPFASTNPFAAAVVSNNNAITSKIHGDAVGGSSAPSAQSAKQNNNVFDPFTSSAAGEYNPFASDAFGDDEVKKAADLKKSAKVAAVVKDLAETGFIALGAAGAGGIAVQDAGHLSGGSKAYEMAELTHEDEDVALYARPDAAGVELAVQAGSANEIVTGRKQANRPDLDWAHMMALNAFWFGYTVYGFVMLVIAVPSQVKALTGEEDKGFGLFVLFVVGGAVNLIASIFLGYACDHVYSPFGRRYSWIVAGSVLLVPTTFLLAGAQSLAVYVTGYAILTILNVVVSVPFNGLFADILNSNQRGKGSAVMGAISQLGALSGAILGLFYSTLGSFGSFGLMLGIYAVSLLVTLYLIKEPSFTREDLARIQAAERTSREKVLAADKSYDRVAQSKALYAWRWTYATIVYPLFEPMIVNVDFRWVFLIRLLMQLGQYTVQEFLQYYLADCVSLPEFDGEPMSPETAVSIVILPMLICATFSALLGGIISDKLGGRRRVLMYASGAIMTVVFLSLIFIRTFVLAAVAGGGLGIGFGCFLAVDFAMVMDVLPSKDDFARDIALWSTALILGQVMATPLAGVLLDLFQTIGGDYGVQCLGYTVIWLLGASYILVATILVRKVKGIK